MSDAKPRCLVVLTALRFTEKYGAAALESARARGEDVVLCLVVDREISEQVTAQLGDVGFLGEKLTHDLKETMIREYRERGMRHLEALAGRARALGLGVETRVLDGAFLESVLTVARESEVSRILVARMVRPHVSRLFFGSEVGRLRRRATCPVDVFDWTGEPIDGPAPPRRPRGG